MFVDGVQETFVNPCQASGSTSLLPSVSTTLASHTSDQGHTAPTMSPSCAPVNQQDQDHGCISSDDQLDPSHDVYHSRVGQYTIFAGGRQLTRMSAIVIHDQPLML